MKYKGLIIDLEGTLVSSGMALPGAIELIKYAEMYKFPVRVITNTVSKSPSELSNILASQDISIPPEHIINPISVLDNYIESHDYRSFLFVGPDFIYNQMKVKTESCEIPEAVILCDFEYINLDYKLLNRVYEYLLKGAILITTSYSPYYISEGAKKLDTGAFTRMFEQVSGQQAIILGKPSRKIYETAVRQLGLSPAEIISIGDDVLTDVQGSVEAGLTPILVRTGKYIPAHEQLKNDCVMINELHALIPIMEAEVLS